MSAADPSTVERLKEAVRRDWSDAAPAWRRWNPQFVATTRAATEAIVQAAQIEPGMRVLDVGTGTGEPALTLAGLVGPNGQVTGTDLSAAVLEIAVDEARRRGLSNITFQPADGEALPFPDESFNLYTCRFTVMFFPDVQSGLREAYRVLEPGRRAIFTAFGPFDQNPYVAAPLGPFLRRAQLPPPDPQAPNPFRFALAGSLAAALREAGFRQVEEESRQIRFRFPGTPEENWQYHHELGAAAFRRFIEALDPEKLEEAKAEALAEIRRYYDGQQVDFPGVMVFATAVR